MLDIVTCWQCHGPISRLLGSTDTIHAQITLDSGFWCDGCSTDNRISAERRFCSAKCLKEFVRCGGLDGMEAKLADKLGALAKRLKSSWSQITKNLAKAVETGDICVVQEESLCRDPKTKKDKD